MFPLLSRLLLLSSLLLGLPLRKLLLALLAFEKRLYLREQDTGQRLHFMGGYSRTVVVDFLFLAMVPILAMTGVYLLPCSYQLQFYVYNKPLFAEHGWEKQESHRELVALVERIRAEVPELIDGTLPNVLRVYDERKALSIARGGDIYVGEVKERLTNAEADCP